MSEKKDEVKEEEEGSGRIHSVDYVFNPTEAMITECYSDNRLDQEKLGLLIKARFAALQPSQIVTMTSLLADTVSDLRCFMNMGNVVHYVNETMWGLIKEMISPLAGEGEDLNMDELTAWLRRRARTLHSGASALFATSTAELMAKTKIITDKLTLDVVNAKRSAAGLMTKQKLLKDDLEKKTKKLAHEINENGKLEGSVSAQSQAVGDLTSDKKQLTSKLEEANLQLEIYKQHSTTFHDEDGKEITSNEVINKADMLSLETKLTHGIKDMVSTMIDEKFGERFASFSDQSNAQRVVDNENVFSEIKAASLRSDRQFMNMMQLLQTQSQPENLLTSAELPAMALSGTDPNNALPMVDPAHMEMEARKDATKFIYGCNILSQQRRLNTSHELFHVMKKWQNMTLHHMVVDTMLDDVTPAHVTKFKQSVIKNKHFGSIHPVRLDEDANLDWVKCRAFFEDRANSKPNLHTPMRAALPQTLSYAETKIRERESEKEAELRRYSDRNKKGRTSSSTHPVYQSEESDQDEDDNDVDKILSMVTTAKKAPRQHVASVEAYMEMEAVEEGGSLEKEQMEEENAYDEDECPYLLGELDILINAKHHLASVGSAVMKMVTDWALKVATALLKVYNNKIKKINSPTSLAALYKIWDAFPKFKPTVKQAESLKEWDAVGNPESNRHRRISIKDYRNQSNDYYQYVSPIYCRSQSSATMTQVINILRSKQAWESRLYKNGNEQGWHAKVLPFVDSSINVPELLKFVSMETTLPVGDINEDVKSVDGGKVYPNELLPCHEGMQSGDWIRAVWLCERKLKFTEEGPILSSPKKKVKAASQQEPVVQFQRPKDATDSDDSDGHYSTEEKDLSDPDPEEEEDALKKLTRKKSKKDQKNRRDSSPGELRLAQELLKVSQGRDRAIEKVKKAKRALQLKDQQEIPELDGDKVNGFKSMNNFITVTKANGYEDGQLINAIRNQEFSKSTKRRRREQWTEAPDMLKFVVNDLEIEFDEELNFLEVASEEYNEEVMKRFWKAWRSDYAESRPAHVREQLIDDAKLVWQLLKPFYYLSPEKWWKLLLQYRVNAKKSNFIITMEMVQKKFFDTLLPSIAGFRADLPKKFVKIRDSKGKIKMDKQLISELYSLYQMFSDKPLNHASNKDRLGVTFQMDPNKPSVIGPGGALIVVPDYMRTAELGFPLALRSETEKDKAKERGKKLKSARSADSVEFRRLVGDDLDSGDMEDEFYAEGDSFELPDKPAPEMQSESPRPDLFRQALLRRKKVIDSLHRSEDGGVVNAHGVYVPGWFRTRCPQLHIDDYRAKPALYDTKLTKKDYTDFYNSSASMGQCCFASCVFHNTKEYRAEMKKRNCTECQCISGVDMDSGKMVGVNLTKWATVPERTRVKELQLTINDRRNRKLSEMQDEKAKAQWLQQCQYEKNLVRTQAIAHWRHLRQLENETPTKSSAAKQVDSLDVERGNNGPALTKDQQRHIIAAAVLSIDIRKKQKLAKAKEQSDKDKAMHEAKAAPTEADMVKRQQQSDRDKAKHQALSNPTEADMVERQQQSDRDKARHMSNPETIVFKPHEETRRKKRQLRNKARHAAKTASIEADMVEEKKTQPAPSEVKDKQKTGESFIEEVDEDEEAEVDPVKMEKDGVEADSVEIVHTSCRDVTCTKCELPRHVWTNGGAMELTADMLIQPCVDSAEYRTCILQGCELPVEVGICPVTGEWKQGCSQLHYDQHKNLQSSIDGAAALGSDENSDAFPPLPLSIAANRRVAFNLAEDKSNSPASPWSQKEATGAKVKEGLTGRSVANEQTANGKGGKGKGKGKGKGFFHRNNGPRNSYQRQLSAWGGQ